MRVSVTRHDETADSDRPGAEAGNARCTLCL
ncbi:hypothetical protein SAMN05428938_8051 [Streptomyces sp. KS_5]|nr:hypothetical protein SAMN05428938_7907 [Streptomyces sp. KS_5]SEE67960.1 hypothetical protein SAMN05428938_8051 [Streptomyces sp. KS_5]